MFEKFRKRGCKHEQIVANILALGGILKIIRRAFAKQVMAASDTRDSRVEAAFAAVAREDFLGPGPWQIVRWGSVIA